MDYDVKNYEANKYFAIFHNIIGKMHAELYEDRFKYLNLTRAFNCGFWN